MKRYILKHNPFDDHGVYNIYPYMDPSRIESQETLNWENDHSTVFFPDNVSFKGMSLVYAEDFGAPAEPHALCDMHTWLGKSPSALTYPVSPRFKKVLASFHIPQLKFYDGSVKWKGAEQMYHVMQLLTRQHQYINFEASTFQECDFRGNRKGNDTPVKVDSWTALQEKFKGVLFTFAEAVMTLAFEELDMFYTDIWGIIITERLKNAIEESQLTGVKIKECPLDFKIASS